jgi:homeobox-leucine zipper protein
MLRLCENFSAHTGNELVRGDCQGGGDALLKLLWQHSDAILCCSLKVVYVSVNKRLYSSTVS